MSLTFWRWSEIRSLIGKNFYKKSGKAFGEDIADQTDKIRNR